MAQAAEPTQKLWDMIKNIHFAMMTTEDGDVLRSRPMAAVDTEFNGVLWFFTRASAHKVTELAEDARVNVSYADPDDQNYVSISGVATLERDMSAIKTHWRETMRTWFPKGTDDPDIALLKVDVLEAEYWDAPSSAMVHAYGYAKAVLTGKPPHPGDHRQVGF
jgi:general stress protein 26